VEYEEYGQKAAGLESLVHCCLNHEWFAENETDEKNVSFQRPRVRELPSSNYLARQERVLEDEELNEHVRQAQALDLNVGREK